MYKPSQNRYGLILYFPLTSNLYLLPDLVLCFQILDAMIVMRDGGIIHCDLKPENILLAPT
jgi:serine/threonine protein kinase